MRALAALLVCVSLMAVSQANYQETSCGTPTYNAPPVPGQTFYVIMPLLYQNYPIQGHFYFYDYSANSYPTYYLEGTSTTEFIAIPVAAQGPGLFRSRLYYSFNRIDPVTHRTLCTSYGYFYFRDHNHEQHAQLVLPVYPMEGAHSGTLVSLYSTKTITRFYCGSSHSVSATVYNDAGTPNYLLYCPADSSNSNYYYEHPYGYFYSSASGSTVRDWIEIGADVRKVNFGPTNFQQQYTVSLNNVRTINFNTVNTAHAYVSYALSRTKVQCQVHGIDGTHQLVKCPGPTNVNKKTNVLVGRFEFHTVNGLQEEGYAQIIVH